MPFNINRIRDQIRNKLGNRPLDPFEFRPPKAKKDEIIKIRMYILPPLNEGDTCNGGTASRGMDDLFCIKHGNHWVNKRAYPCPRTNHDWPCEMCDTGFEQLRAIPKNDQNQDARQAVVRNWLSQQVYLVNIYFPNISSNPESLRGKVMFFNAPKTCFDQWTAAINRDAGGDTADPEAYGVFYDPEAAFMYQLEIQLSGNNNSYKTSRFLASMGAHPIARKKDQSIDEKRIQDILDQRHDLWTKIEVAKPEVIHKLVNQIMNGDDSEGDESAQAQQTPAKPTPAKPAPAKPMAKPAPAKPMAKPAARPAPADDETLDESSGDDDQGVPFDEPESPADEATLETEVEAPPAKVGAKAPAKPALAKPMAKPAPVKPAPAKPAPAKPAAKPAPAKPAAKAATSVANDDEIDRLLDEITPDGGQIEDEVAQE
jgi:hypothetical protein